MIDLGLLVPRLVTGPLLAGHGAQKLFGWFGGPGLEGTAAWLESLGFRPRRLWAPVAGLTELLGGILTTLGLFHPLGPLVVYAPMAMAIARVHWGKPIWVASGGAELPVTNMAIATSQALTGPGKFSADYRLGIRVPGVVSLIAGMGVAAGIAYGVATTYRPPSPPRPTPQQTPREESLTAAEL